MANGDPCEHKIGGNVARTNLYGVEGYSKGAAEPFHCDTIITIGFTNRGDCGEMNCQPIQKA